MSMSIREGGMGGRACEKSCPEWVRGGERGQRADEREGEGA